jgi:hypothetical protein
MAFNGITPEDLLRRGRYIARWVTDFVKNEAGTAQIQVLGYCVYDSKDCKTLFEHQDREVCQKLANILNEEDNNVRRT